jgi:hypothetical protein
VCSVSLSIEECLSKATRSLWFTNVSEECDDIGVTRKNHVEAKNPGVVVRPESWMAQALSLPSAAQVTL